LRVVRLSSLAHNPRESFGVLPLYKRPLSARIMTERILNMDEISFRPLNLTDAEEVARVIRAAFAAQPRSTQPPSSALKETVVTVAAKIAAGGGIGAFASGALVGAVLWEIKARALHVGRVSVIPAWRGRGLAGALIKACESEARLRRLTRVTLRVRLELPENERLFERVGFERRELDAHEGFDRPTQAVMEKLLA
jgi:predicted N-acetyltransferase YhbS